MQNTRCSAIIGCGERASALRAPELLSGCTPGRDAPQDRVARAQLGHFGETRFAHEERNSMLISEVGTVEEMRDDTVHVTRASEIERVEGAAAPEHSPHLA